MNRSDDDDNMDLNRTTPVLDDRAVDALLAGWPSAGHGDLLEVVAAVRTSVCVQAPPPNPTLAAVLERGLQGSGILVRARADRGRVRQWAVRTAVILAAAAATTVSAAAANALPAPVQSAVADAVGALTPFDLPRSVERDRADDNRVPDDLGPSSDLPSAPTTIPPAEDVRPPVVPDRTAPVPRSGTGVTDAADRAETRSPDVEPADRPDIGAPELEIDTPEPETNEPETNEPETNEPEADEPEADEPETDEPETDLLDSEEGADLPEVDGLDEGPSDEASTEAAVQPPS